MSGNFDTKYFIDEEKGICTVVIKHSEWEAQDYFEKMNNNGILFRIDKFKMPAKFVGIAKCHPQDKFDAMIGSDLAFDRAYRDYLSCLKVTLKNISDYVRRRSEILDDHIENSNKFKVLRNNK